VLRVLRCAKNAPQRQKKNANPSRLSEKKVYCVESLEFVYKVEISVLRGVEWVPQKSAHFGATAPAKKHLRSRWGTQKAIFIEFGDTKKCCTFSGLELVPKSRKKANWRSQLHAKRSKCIQTLWDQWWLDTVRKA